MILTIIIFFIGIFFGMWLDQLRIEGLRRKIEEVVIAWEDAKLQNLYFLTFPFKDQCESVIKQNIEFSDRVYYTIGKMLEEYEKVNKFSPELVSEKQKYVMLKLQFWLNSIYLKKRCNATYVNVVYFYSHYTKDLVLQQKQEAQSVVLLELKEEYGNKMLLIPLPIDMNITTIEVIKSNFNITIAPTILINEEIKLVGLQSKEKLKKVIESCFK
jgi:hypothetical protein